MKKYDLVNAIQYEHREQEEFYCKEYSQGR